MNHLSDSNAGFFFNYRVYCVEGCKVISTPIVIKSSHLIFFEKIIFDMKEEAKTSTKVTRSNFYQTVTNQPKEILGNEFI